MSNIIIIIENSSLRNGQAIFGGNAYPDKGFGWYFNITITESIFEITAEEINEKIKSLVAEQMLSNKMIDSADKIILIGGAT